MESTTANRRKLTNAIVDAPAQLRLSVPFLLMFGTTVGIVLFIAFSIYSILSNQLTTIDPEILNVLLLVQRQVLLISSIGIALLGFLSAFLWMRASHRIFGPIVQIERQIDNFKQGRFDHKITLRKNDEFKRLADQLNDLGTILSRRK